MSPKLTKEEIEQFEVYEARTEGVWYVVNDADFPAAWAQFSFDGMNEIGLDVEFTKTPEEGDDENTRDGEGTKKIKMRRTAALVQMTSARGTLLYHSWRTSGEFLFVWA